jgi:hypothetical protein
MSWSGDASTPALPPRRGTAVDELIALVGAVDAVVRGQALADCDYISRTCGRDLSQPELHSVQETILDAYRL